MLKAGPRHRVEALALPYQYAIFAVDEIQRGAIDHGHILAVGCWRHVDQVAVANLLHPDRAAGLGVDRMHDPLVGLGNQQIVVEGDVLHAANCAVDFDLRKPGAGQAMPGRSGLRNHAAHLRQLAEVAKASNTNKLAASDLLKTIGLQPQDQKRPPSDASDAEKPPQRREMNLFIILRTALRA